MVLGKTYVLWMAQPKMASGKTTRGAVGFVTDTAASFDLVAGIDSAFTVVETANPECASQTASYRQQKPWVDLVNQANDLANAGQMDSAVVLAKRSIQLSKNAPYGYNVLAQAAMKSNQPKEAIAQFKLAIGAAKDSSMADTKRQLLAYLGNYASDQADNAQGADKAAYIAEAKSAYEQLAKDPGTKYADNARSRSGSARDARRRLRRDQGLVLGPTREPGRLLIQLAHDGRRYGRQGAAEQGRDQAVRGGPRGESLSTATCCTT